MDADLEQPAAALRAGTDADVVRVLDDAADEVLVPFVAEIVPVVDVPGGRLQVVPPPGLLDDAGVGS